jgi:epoxyqueuosine reductase
VTDRATEFAKRTARNEGFDLVGIAEAKPLEEESRVLMEWLRRGYNGTMNWMEKSFEKRTDPRKVLDGAKSVISLGKNYYSPVDRPQGFMKISRYAWGQDYHIVIDEMLKRYLGKMRQQFPVNKFSYYCDTGPVMDKVWAQHSGIGWIGKHTNVISREMGSWVFLAEVITDLEFEYDIPAVDHCGSCSECIDACPTEAIVEPYVLDANKCISFLTIENRDDKISTELAPKLENWVFGCDVCQDVCPWNKKFQTPTDNPAFSPHKGNLNLRADDIHLMTREEFSARFHHTPVKRAKFEGFRRNAKVVLEYAEMKKDNKVAEDNN